MSETALGLLGAAFLLIGGVMVRHSLRTGESITPWPMGPVTRAENPVIYWFDLSSSSAIMLLGVVAIFKLLN